MSGRAGLGNGVALRLKVHRGVAVRGFNACVPEPVADRDQVDSRLEQVSGARVAHHMGVNAVVSRINSLGESHFVSAVEASVFQVDSLLQKELREVR